MEPKTNVQKLKMLYLEKMRREAKRLDEQYIGE